MSSNFSSHAYFLDSGEDRLYCLERNISSTSPQETLILVPPFGEEMNKSRRMFTLLSESLGKKNIRTVTFDLHGTGDSTGDFGETSWDGWCQNLADIHQHIAQSTDRISFLGLRSGALLAAQGAQTARIEQLIFWQPILKGQTMMTQFLRLYVAANMNSDAKHTTTSLREQIRTEPLEIAGYKINNDILSSIDQLEMETLLGGLNLPISWFEVNGKTNKPLSVGTRKLLEKLEMKNIKADSTTGDAFWSTQEITSSPNLIRLTSDCFN